MPLYRYQCDHCQTYVEAFHSSDAVPEKEQCQQCGHPASRRYGARAAALAGNWPMCSEALAVHSSQVQEAREHAAKHGVPTDFRKDGAPVFRSQRHRRDYCRLYGYIDRNGSYGDPT